ncbi:MAG TPA: hypothetical protein V6C95_12625 [Coleofasciculaceae cyanobacterium]
MNSFKELSLKLKFFWGSLFYLTYAPKAYLYSRKRDRIERDFPRPLTEDTFDKPGKLLRAEPTLRGGQFGLGGASSPTSPTQKFVPGGVGSTNTCLM